jgi:peptidoglycan/xylan/chitin deacetylase (PgdA/CDA1 family)
MPLLIKKIIEIGGVFLIFLLMLIFVFLYFEAKKIERLSIKLEETALSTQGDLTKLPTQKVIPSPQNETTITEKTPVGIEPKSEFIPSEVPLKNKKIAHLPILTYHHIDFLPPGASKEWQDLTVSPRTFEKQMEYLFQQNYQPITFSQFINFLKTDREIPEKSLIITFDDGWKNQYLYAFPILKKYNFKAAFFIVVNQIGGDLFMNWSQLKELLNSGMEIGSHTMSHPNLKKLNSSQLIYEIEKSKTILEKNLNYRIEVFAYPYGIFDSRIIEAVGKANYRMARTTVFGLDQNIENWYTLKAIQVYDSLQQLKRIFPPTK